jgi:creatinase
MLHVFQWKNGDKEWSPFSDCRNGPAAERHARGIWPTKNIDAAVFTSYHGICYYSGFLYCYFGRKFGFVLTQDNATTVSAGIDGGQPWRRSHGDNIIYSDWRRDNFFTALKSLIPARETHRHRVRPCLARLPQAARRCVSGRRVRRCRRSVDVDAHDQVGRGACADPRGHAHLQCRRAGGDGRGRSEGVPEYEVALASTQAMVREIGKSFPFVELMDTWTWFQSGIMTDGAHNPVTNKKSRAATSCRSTASR